MKDQQALYKAKLDVRRFTKSGDGQSGYLLVLEELISFAMANFLVDGQIKEIPPFKGKYIFQHIRNIGFYVGVIRFVVKLVKLIIDVVKGN